MMKKILYTILGFALALGGVAFAAIPFIQPANGGSGWGTPGGIQAHTVLIGNGLSPYATATPSTAGYVLTSNGVSADPTFKTLPAGGSGVGTISTSTVPTIGQIPYWTTSGAYPELLGSVATGTISANTNISLSGGPAFIIGPNLTISGITWPFIANVGFVSTTTVLGLNGFFSTASSTISNAFHLSSLSDGNLVVFGGLVQSNASTTFSSPLVYTNSTGAVNCPTCNTSSASVTSVAATVPVGFSISGSPVTTNGTLGILTNLSPNTVIASNSAGTGLVASSTLYVDALIATSTTKFSGFGTTTPAQEVSVNGKVYTTSGIQFGDGTLQTTAATPSTPIHPYASSGVNNLQASNGYATTSLMGIPSGTLTASSTITVEGEVDCNPNGAATTCSVFVTDGTGKPFGTSAVITPGGNSNEDKGYFKFNIINNSSVSSQNFMQWAAIGRTDSAVSWPDVQNQGTASIDTSQAFSIGIRIRANGNGQFNLLNYSIIINP